MIKSFLNPSKLVFSAILATSCGTAEHNFRSKDQVKAAEASSETGQVQVNFSVNADQIDSGDTGDSMAGLALASNQIVAPKIKLECEGFQRETENGSIMIPSGSKGCVAKLLEFRIASGVVYSIEKDFTAFTAGSSAVFRVGNTNRRAQVLISSALPSPIAASAQISFFASEFLDSGKIIASRDFEAKAAGNVDTATNLTINRVSIVGTDQLRIEFRCADADVMGSSLTDAKCYSDLVTSHKFAVGTAPAQIDQQSLRSIFASGAKSFSAAGATLEVLPYQSTVRKMLVVQMKVDLTGASDRLVIIGKDQETWLRYRAVAMPK